MFLNLAVVVMFAFQGRLPLDNPGLLFRLLLPLLLFFLINFFMPARLVARLMRFSYGLRAAATMTVLARNSPLALTLVVSAFPEKPLTALALTTGPLIELPVLFPASYAVSFFGPGGNLGPARPKRPDGIFFKRARFKAVAAPLKTRPLKSLWPAPAKCFILTNFVGRWP